MRTEPNDYFLHIEAIFHDALKEPLELRRACVLRLCGGDEKIADDVFHLIDALDGADDFLESGPTTGDLLNGDSCASQWPHVGPEPSVESQSEAADPSVAATRSGFESVGEFGRGSVVGPFTLERLLGTGGAGAVFEAVQDHPHRRVAIKLVRTGAGSLSMQRRFDYEIAILAQLHHPNIAQVYEAGRIGVDDASVQWFAMELVEDALDLLTYAETHGLVLRDRLRLFQKVCDAVDYGHRRGVVHRDLKPANILVDGSGRPRVIDFGVACTTDTDLMLTTMQTQVGQLIGTAQYMSPEQWRANPEEIDGRSDVYSLGSVLFELLVGCPPHDLSGVPLIEAQRIVLQSAPSKPSSIRADLSLDLDTLILKSLAKDAQRRYETPGDLSRDIGRYLDHEPILARPPSALYHLSLFTRRNRAVVVSLCLLSLILSLAVGVSTSYAIDATHARDEADSNAQETDRLFEKGRHLTRWIIDDFFAQVRDIPGGTGARHALTTQVLAYLEGLISDASSPEFRREVASNFVKLGELQGRTDQDNVGEPKAAVLSFDRALAIYRGISGDSVVSGAAHPDDTLEVARILSLKAGIEDEAGDHAAATADRLEARSRLEGLLGRASLQPPLKWIVISRIANIDLDEAWRQIFRGELAGASTQLQAILAQQEGLLAERAGVGSESVEAVEMTVLTANAYLAELYQRTGDFDAAARHSAAVLELCEAASDAEELSLRAKQRLAQACTATGDVLIFTGRLIEAQRNYERALEIHKALVVADSKSVHAKRKLAISHQRTGDVLVQLGKLSDALEHYLEDYAFAVEFAGQGPGNRHAQRAHWISADKVGTCYYQLHRYEAAEPYLLESLAVAQRLATAEDPDLVDLQGVAQAHTSLGTLVAVSDESRSGMEEAVKSLQKAEACWLEIERLGQLTAQQEKLRAANLAVLKIVEDSLKD